MNEPVVIMNQSAKDLCGWAYFHQPGLKGIYLLILVSNTSKGLSVHLVDDEGYETVPQQSLMTQAC